MYISRNFQKKFKLEELAKQRRLDKQEGLTRTYKQVGDFHQGVYDSWCLVSPWSKSACNADASIMVVAQDWTSEEAAKKVPKNIELGHDPNLPTNKHLKELLFAHFNCLFSDVYATNLFVFVKPGNLSARIPASDMRYSAKKYTLAEIEIVKPKLVICLGASTYYSLCKVIGVKAPKFKLSVDNLVDFNGIKVCGVPHTGGLGTKNAGGLNSVHQIWTRLAQTINLA